MEVISISCIILQILFWCCDFVAVSLTFKGGRLANVAQPQPLKEK